MRAEKVAKNDPRVRLATFLSSVGVCMAIGGLAWDVVSTDGDAGSPYAHALSALGFVCSAIGQVRVAQLRREIFMAINVPISLFVAYARATGSSDSFAPPGWLTAFGIVILVALLGGAIPFAVYIVIREQDERELKIVMSSMSLAFLATLLTVVTFVLLDKYTAVRPPGISWVLLVAAASWFASYSVLKERM